VDHKGFWEELTDLLRDEQNVVLEIDANGVIGEDVFE
jgi:hypothetical protein